MSLETKIKDILEGKTDVQLTEAEIARIQEEADKIKDQVKETVTESKEETTDEVVETKEETVEESFSIDEHIKALSESVEGLSEESLKKVSTVFEAAVADGIKAKQAQLEEEFATKLEEATEAKFGELVEHIDGFINQAVDNWIEDNRLALESGIKSDMFESFVNGMKNLFTENYVDVPEDKLSVIEEQAKTIADLSSKLESLEEEKKQSDAEKIKLQAEATLEAVCESLAATEVEKIKSLAEGIEFISVEDYTSKIETLKESYFPKSIPSNEEITATSTLNESVAAYVKYLK